MKKQFLFFYALCKLAFSSLAAIGGFIESREEFFIENKRQWRLEVLYVALVGGLDVWITKEGVNYTFFKQEKLSFGLRRGEAGKAEDKFDHHPEDYIFWRGIGGGGDWHGGGLTCGCNGQFCVEYDNYQREAEREWEVYLRDTAYGWLW